MTLRTRGVYLAVLATLVVLTGCSSETSGAGRSRAAPSPQRTPGIDLSRISTREATISINDLRVANEVTVAGLVRLVDGGFAPPLQILSVQQFTSTSAIDLLRLSTGLDQPPEVVRRQLQDEGWLWLIGQEGITGTAVSYRSWRPQILRFSTAAGASQYLRHPVLLPPALARAPQQPGPAELGEDTVQIEAMDAVVPLSDPGMPAAGGRRALLWRRGQLVLAVIVEGTPQAPAPATLLEVARVLAARSGEVPGNAGP